MAFADLFPGAQLRIDHSISFGGYYCQVSGGPALTAQELGRFGPTCRNLSTLDIPFLKREVPLKEAIEYFECPRLHRQGPAAASTGARTT